MSAAGTPRRPVLYLIACGGRPAGSLAPFIVAHRADGWEVCVIVTPTAMRFVDISALAALTGYPVRTDFRQPLDPDMHPPADVIAVAPATFNTINKWAGGISDTLALGLLNEAIGLGTPIVAVPTPNIALARHPVFAESVARLRRWGVRLLYDPDTYPLPQPDAGAAAAEAFPWQALTAELARVRARLGGGGASVPERHE